MTFANEGSSDRAVRMFAGIVLLAAGWSLASGVAAVVLGALGAIALATGIVGWCPAYMPFGFSTRPALDSGHCPDCETHLHR